ncbi:class I SAM-dependent methyltransferase [Akkermansia muciniphila]|uniref:class I SAM-dependent methyltransferase n=1 Tax=Akkermansia muciniphila TaxID=239935 RepID=UPI001BFEF5AC|nr:class I SAM-dependent methyltransferase [Akkermansia muciniphila]MBT8778922.1 class I SAM-dependent methyltransferase [Akkermansia muciniphila]
MKCSLLSRPMTCAHGWISSVVHPGDTVADATAGNGHDTVFLARLAGPAGHVHAFDVQEEAIRSTRERLEEAGLLTPSVHLHLASHDRLAELVSGPVKAIVFNLGYLPGGDKKTVTRTDSTLAALEQAAALIAPNGLLSVMCYPGHEGGDAEAEAVEAFLSRLPHHTWRTGKYQLLNTGSPAPFQVCAFRLD